LGDGQALAPAVARAATILDVLAEAERPMGLSELGRRVSAAKSSVANICAALVDAGLLRRTPEGYALGQRLVRLAASYLADVDLVREFYAACHAHAGVLTETMQLAVLDGGLGAVYLARRDGAHPVRLASDIGRTLPATTTATGKAMLAGLTDEELKSRLAGVGELPVLTDRSIRSFDQLTTELAQIRRQGYATDDEETLEGLYCIAVALPASGDARERAAISCTLLGARVTAERRARLLDHLQLLARDLTDRLGGSLLPQT
jgi:IclR family transcriptional regulator, blcABC operon repressor